MVAKLAESEHLTARDWFDGGEETSTNGRQPAEWMLMASAGTDLGGIMHDARWIQPKVLPSTPLWTDDFTNIWSVLKRR